MATQQERTGSAGQFGSFERPRDPTVFRLPFAFVVHTRAGRTIQVSAEASSLAELHASPPYAEANLDGDRWLAFPEAMVRVADVAAIEAGWS